jgi:hypothetical protein
MFGQFNDSPVVETKTAPTEKEGETTQVEVESETTEKVEEQAAQETTTEDTDSEDSDVQEAEDTDDETVKKPKKGFEKRIERFNKKLSDKDLEIEYWKKAAMGGTTAEVRPVQSAPQGKPTFAEYNDIESYTEALTDWKVSQALSSRDQQTQTKSVVDTYGQRLNEFKKSTPDFQDVMDEFVDEYGDRPIPEVVQVAMESEYGPQIAYYLAKNTNEVDRIALLPPHRRLLELGKLEERLSKATTQQKEVVPETKRISKAPEPIEKVKGTGKVETNDIYADLPYEQWVKVRTKKK